MNAADDPRDLTHRGIAVGTTATTDTVAMVLRIVVEGARDAIATTATTTGEIATIAAVATATTGVMTGGIGAIRAITAAATTAKGLARPRRSADAAPTTTTTGGPLRPVILNWLRIGPLLTTVTTTDLRAPLRMASEPRPTSVKSTTATLAAVKIQSATRSLPDKMATQRLTSLPSESSQKANKGSGQGLEPPIRV